MCVQHRYTSKFPSTNSNTHTTMATPLSIFYCKCCYSICETLVWVAFLIFLMYLMRVIKNFGTRELILMGVELPWIFLFKHCYCKIADLVRRKGRFETKKQKDVRHDGTLSFEAKIDLSFFVDEFSQKWTKKPDL